MPKYQSTKTYGTDRGLSCCFRQWRASHSHCSTLHGYSLGFKFVFESETLDSRNWAFDFGGMKPIKDYLDHMFDHTVLVAKDDPLMHNLLLLGAASSNPEFQARARDESNKAHQEGRLCDIRIVDGVGCELTAKMVYEKSAELLRKMKNGKDTRYEINPDVRLVSVECFEHGANSAIYYGGDGERDTEVTTSPEDDFLQSATLAKLVPGLTSGQATKLLDVFATTLKGLIPPTK
jgi:6-pyruvoyltetrahydropterin/6-carboxytetrahydropterin synthase